MRPIALSTLGEALQEMQLHLIRHITTHGNGPLQSGHEDPFRWQRTAAEEGEGGTFYFIAKSTRTTEYEGQYLTYRVLLEALMGLFDVMYTAEMPWGAYVIIEQEGMEELGRASILPRAPW